MEQYIVYQSSRKLFLCIQHACKCHVCWLRHTRRFDLMKYSMFHRTQYTCYGGQRKTKKKSRIFAKHSFISHNFLMLFSLSYFHFNVFFSLHLLLLCIHHTPNRHIRRLFSYLFIRVCATIYNIEYTQTHMLYVRCTYIVST